MVLLLLGLFVNNAFKTRQEKDDEKHLGTEKHLDTEELVFAHFLNLYIFKHL